jgi:hypothetical protein
VVDALVVHHHVHDLAGLGDADGDFFGLHGGVALLMVAG